MSDKPVLFFSKHCPHCQNLWKQLASKDQLGHFVKICVDNNTNVPPAITSVPTIYIKGRPLLTGPAIQMFLNSNHTVSPIQSVSTPPSIAGSVSGSGGVSSGLVGSGAPLVSSSTGEGISDYLPMEMGGSWSDNYSFIEGSNPLGHSFHYLGAGETVTSSGGPAGGGGRRSRSSGVDSKYEQLMASRKSDPLVPSPLMRR